MNLEKGQWHYPQTIWRQCLGQFNVQKRSRFTEGKGSLSDWKIRWILWLTIILLIASLTACADDSNASPTLEPLLVTETTSRSSQPSPSDTPRPEPTDTLTPVSTNTPSNTSTSTPSATHTPTNTSSPPPQPETICTPPSGTFTDIWQKNKGRLGCPLQLQPTIITDAEQVFQNGHMFWWKHLDIHLVVYNKGPLAGMYEMYANEWIEGDPRTSCSVPVPEGFIQPVRGFGRIWCKLGADESAIGWALAPEAGFESGNADPMVQAFEEGYIFRDSDGTMNGLVYVLFGDGTYVRRAY